MSYSYIKLEDVINNYLMGRSQDDLTAMTPRYQILYQARKGVRELYFNILREIKGVELTLSSTLTVPLPVDYVNYVRISWVDNNNMLHPIAINDRQNVSKKYLQDSSYNVLFDNNGNPLFDNNPNEISKNESSGMCYTFQPNKDMSLSYKLGSFRIDTSEGLILFGSGIPSKKIVIEYITDGLHDDNDIKIHKFAEQALLDYIYYHLIKNRRNVPMNEKLRARKEYYNSRRIAKRMITPLSYADLIKVFSGDSKWIK